MRFACVGDVGVDKYLNLGLSRPGGCSLNVAVHLSRLASGFDVRLLSVVGDDAAADSLKNVLAQEALSLFVDAFPGRTATQCIELLKGGERKFAGYDAGVLEDFVLSDEQKRVIQVSDYVMTLVYSQFEDAFAQVLAAPRRGKLVVDFMDLTDYGGNLTLLEEGLRHADLGFFGLNDATNPVIGELERRTAGTAKKYVVTLGSLGSLWLEDGKRLHAPAVPIPMVVDTTGAGDAFAAAFLSRYLEGSSPQDSLAFASQHAATVVTQIGGFPFQVP